MSKEGWNWLSNSSRNHYFLEDSRSICGKWFCLGDPSGRDMGLKDCAACIKKLAAREKKNAEGSLRV